MSRRGSVLVLAAAFSLTPATRAAVEPNPVTVRPPAGSVRLPAPPTPSSPADFVLTPRSVIVLNGRECAYRDVPASASVARVEVAGDGKTVIRIEFSSPSVRPVGRPLRGTPRAR